MNATATAHLPVGAAPRRATVTPTGSLVRLTRRGRLVVTLFFLAVALAALTLFSGYSAATDGAGSGAVSATNAVEAGATTRTVEVREGDTLWVIADRIAGPGEIREVVHEIRELNRMPDVALVEGQRIAVPVR